MAKRKKREENSVQQTSRKHKRVSKRIQRQQRLLFGAGAAVVLFVILVVGYGVLNNTVLKERRPVARVNGEVITVGQFQKRVRFQRATYILQLTNDIKEAQMFAQNPLFAGYFAQQLQSLMSKLSDAQALGKDVLNGMVDEKLIIQEAKRRGITVTDAEVEKALQEAFGYYPNGTPTPTITPTVMPTSTLSPTQLALLPPTPTPTTLPAPPTPAASPTATATMPAVTATPTKVPPTPTPYTEQAYKKNLQNYLDQIEKLAGVSEKDVREILRARLYTKKLYEAITADVPRVQEQVWARHILVKDKKTAEEVRKQLLAGASWEELAKKYSQDTGTKNKGGDLGWFGRGQMVKEFEDAAFSLKIGEISQPVKTQYGWHIIQVLGHEKRPVSESTYRQLKQQAWQNWLEEARSKAKIETYDIWAKVVPTKPVLPPDVQAQVEAFIAAARQQQQPQLPQPQPTPSK